MIHTVSADISQRLSAIDARIAAACERTGRAGVELVAVSKVQPEERVDALLKAGHRVFGENRVQEAQTRWSERRLRYPDLKLHLIGPLQTNKVEPALKLFDVIETLDRPKLARALAKAQLKTGLVRSVLIQVNTGEEPQKAGVLLPDLAALVALAKDLGLQLDGLMCIPPVEEPAGPHFALLAKLAAQYDLPSVSMGMSSDFETAIGFGATHVRVGSALFGDRVPAQPKD